MIVKETQEEWVISNHYTYVYTCSGTGEDLQFDLKDAYEKAYEKEKGNDKNQYAHNHFVVVTHMNIVMLDGGYEIRVDTYMGTNPNDWNREFNPEPDIYIQAFNDTNKACVAVEDSQGMGDKEKAKHSCSLNPYYAGTDPQDWCEDCASECEMEGYYDEDYFIDLWIENFKTEHLLNN